ncbi:MAG: acetolactate synthase large subunit [Nitrospirae bacterium]|nr:acetolactate synthase large subunit [Nitrospirota bacterium]
MKAAELFVRCLEAEGAEYIFGLPGEENIELLNALSSTNINFILAHDERCAAFMANAYGRLSGKPGVCLSTLGPGATNLITGVADALLDYSPMVAISGQVELSKIHKESHQYIDILSTFKPLTKWNIRIESPHTIPEIVRKAFKVASIEKPGPSHIEFPEDIASMEAEGSPLPYEQIRYPEPTEDMLFHAVSMIRDANMPLILAGNGVNRGRSTRELRRFVSKTGIGVTTTFMGTGALPADDECFISTIGLQSNDYISCGLDKSDLIIAVGYDPVEFSPRYWNTYGKKNIIHINYTPSETDAYYTAFELVGDIKNTLSLLTDRINFNKDIPYYHKLKLFADHALHFSSKGFPLKPLRIVNEIRKALRRDDILISDVGAHKIWIARFYPAYEGNTVIISNGFASMGFALPAAISAKLLYQDKNIIAAVGDGGFLMSISEMNTAVRLGLNFVCLIFNDGGYGLIEWKERLKYNRDFFVKFKSPDFVKLAESFGARGYKVASEDELFPALKEALGQNVPAVIDCPVDYSENPRLTEKLGRIICPA